MALETAASSPRMNDRSGTDVEAPSLDVLIGHRQTVRRMLQASARSRLQQLGPQALSDVELLSLVLRSDRLASASEIAENLLAAYGSFRRLIVAEPRSAQAHGLTSSNYATLHAALEIARRHYQELLCAGPVIANPHAVREFLRMRLRDLPHEMFCCLYLDNRHRFIAFSELFRGTIDSASVHPREVVKQALAFNSAAVILAHNHPSGVCEPSQADELITRRLKEALGLVEIRLLDHLIVGDSVVESFASRGLL